MSCIYYFLIMRKKLFGQPNILCNILYKIYYIWSIGGEVGRKAPGNKKDMLRAHGGSREEVAKYEVKI